MRGNHRVHRPGQFRPGRGAELLTREEEDVGDIGELLHRLAVEQIAWDGLDPFKLCPSRRVGEPGHGDHLVVPAQLLQSLPEHQRERRAHLADRAEHKQIAADSSQRFEHALGGLREKGVDLIGRTGWDGVGIHRKVTNQLHSRRAFGKL